MGSAPSPLNIIPSIQLFSLQFPGLLKDVFGGCHCLFLVHLEGTRRLTLTSLLLESIVFDNVFHKFVWRFLIELLWQSSNIFNTIRSHALISGGEVCLITIGLIISQHNILPVLIIGI